ncbi:protein numb-like [Amphibalanus amphitrite]|uniref:protein numb-like n=1 Tax=Amphibalanus amphitrite TaxID=1232801 RepID=UPI001C914080|nr:protein numb-like [Amphibalanus amphitrite]
MDRLKRSLKESIRKKQYGPAVYRPNQWANDEAAVKNGICSFHVKYLGCAQVYESRGLHVCEDALRMLKSQRRRVRSVLFISGDRLRVVADETKELLVDQTIEKVSFCAPDRSSDRGFSYICRDGATRRWMCHGFIATRDSGPDQLVTGERLSHAVGVAFGLCLERKQRRDSESSTPELYELAPGADTGLGAFRRASITERLTDPQDCKPAEPVPLRSVTNPFAVERPHAPTTILERQGSLRIQGRHKQAEVSAFKRQHSLKLDDLPSTQQRVNETTSDEAPSGRDTSTTEAPARAPVARGRLMSLPYGGSPSPEGRTDLESGRPGRFSTERPRQMSLAGTTPLFDMAPIAEVPTSADNQEGNVTLLCRELAHGLSQLSGNQQRSGAATDATPRPDDWLNSLTNGPALAAAAAPHRRGRSPSLASDALISSSVPWSAAPAPAAAPWPAAAPAPAAPATNPFVGPAAVTDAKPFELQM